MDVLPVATQSATYIYANSKIADFFTVSGMIFWGLFALVGIITVGLRLFKNGIVRR